MLKIFHAEMPPITTECLNWYTSECCKRKKQLNSVGKLWSFVRTPVSLYLSRNVYTEVAQNCIFMCIVDLKPKTFQSYLVTSVILHWGREKKKKKKDVNNRPKSKRIHDKFIKIYSEWSFFPVWWGTLYGWNWLFDSLQICVGFWGAGWSLFCFGVYCFLVVWVWDFRNKWGHVVKMWPVVWEVGLCYCL